MTKTWTVYVHINKINNKKYVGITSRKNPEQRWCCGRGYNKNPRFYSAIKKYGWDGFYHIILAEGFDEYSAKRAECNLIKFWNTQNDSFGYNMTSGGDGTRGYHPSKETRAKLSYARMKENLSEETISRRSAGLRGRVFTEEHKRKIGDGNSKAVEMLSTDGVLLKEFKSAYSAEVECGISHSHISQCCNGHRKSAGGYVWRFAQ